MLSEEPTARELGESLALAMVKKCGLDLSAPINFQVSRPWYRTMDRRDMSQQERADFTDGYYEAWRDLKKAQDSREQR